MSPSQSRPRWREALAGLAVSAAIITVSSYVSSTSDVPARDKPLPTRAPSSELLLAHGSDRKPNLTAEDWVTYADHVVIARAVSETANPPARSEIERGEGLITRDVHMVVDQVLWSAPDAPKPAPQAWDRTSMGWHFKGTISNRTAMGLAEASRVEVAHTYAIAIEWVPDPCRPGEGDWLGLGQGSTIPFDDGLLGVGEFEGSTHALGEAPFADEGAEPSLRKELMGHSQSDLALRVRSAQPIPAHSHLPYPKLVCD